MNTFKVIDGDTVTIIESDLDFKGFQAITNWNYCIELLGSDSKAVKIGFGLKNPIDCIKQVKTETKTKTILPTAILFAAIQAKKQGITLNTFVSKNARCFNAAIRSFWLTIKTNVIKTITVIKDIRFSNIFNIVTEKTNVSDFVALGFITRTQFETLSAKGVKVVVL